MPVLILVLIIALISNSVMIAIGRMEIIKLGLIKVVSLDISPRALGKAVQKRVISMIILDTAVPFTRAPTAPNKEAPDSNTDNDNDEDRLAGFGVRVHLRRLELLLLVFLRSRAISLSANRSLRKLFAVDTGVRGHTADAGDINLHETIEHVATLARHVERNHVAGIVEEHVSQVSSVLVDTSGLAFERPVVARGPNTGTCLEAGAAFPLHVVDEGFRADVVADKILVTAEEEDVDTRLNETGEEVHRWDGVLCYKCLSDPIIAFLPCRFLGWIDVQGVDDICASEIWFDILQIGRPAHAAGAVILQADIVHIQTFVVLDCRVEIRLEHEFTGRQADLVLPAGCVQLRDADFVESVQVAVEGRSLLDETFSLEEGYCRGILIYGRDESVANE